MSAVGANFVTSTPRRPRRRIYSEIYPLDELARESTLRRLAARDLELVVALWPNTLAATLQIAARATDLGVRVTLWPMLDDDAGRWVSVANVEPYADFVRVVVGQGDICRELLIDLEPPIGQMQRPVQSWLSQSSGASKQDPKAQWHKGRRALHRLLDELGARGITRTAAVIPLVVYDGKQGRSWQQLLGTPVDGLPFDHIQVMAYTTLFQGYSRGLLGRKDALMLLDDLCTAAKTKYGDRAGISLGCTGQGALGDEQAYRALGELVEDLQHTAAAAIDDVALFELGGVLRRPDADAWLDRFAARDEVREAAIEAVKMRQPSRRARILAWLFAQSFGAGSDEDEAAVYGDPDEK